MAELWSAASAYEMYMGRWSRPMARRFLEWLVPAGGLDWLDVGCGTGALSRTLLDWAEPRRVVGVDPSEAFVGFARARVADERATFEIGDARALPVADAAFDHVVSGLVLNFVPEPERAVREMVRAVRPGGGVALFVWDYAQGMGLIRQFFDAARSIDPHAVEHDEGERFTICRPDALEAALEAGGLAGVIVEPLEITAVFADFEDYWLPFLFGRAPAPAYCMALAPALRARLRARLESDLAPDPDGCIRLPLRAWAGRGRTPADPGRRVAPSRRLRHLERRFR